MESRHHVLAHVVLVAQARTRKRQSYLTTVLHLVVLQLAHRQQTVIQRGELQQTHPFVLCVLAPLNRVQRTPQPLAQLP